MFVTPRFILIISTFCISFNAQAKEMTIDILAGNWSCSPIIEQFSHINDDMSQLDYVDVDKEDSIGEVFWSYIKIDDKNIKIMTDKDPDDSDDIEIPFKAKLNYSEKTTDGVTNSFNEYEYVNDDEMITTDNYEELHYDTNKKLTDDSFGYKYRNRCLKVNID